MARIVVHVSPRSSRNEVRGWQGGQLQVHVTAVPEDGKANAAVTRLLAEALGIAKSRVSVVRGHTARTKHIHIDSVDDEVVRRVFGVPQEGLF